MNNNFQFKQFTIYHDKCGMKVGTDGVLLGAWVNIDDSQFILDVGTGTGLIAIMLAQRSTASITAIEIEKDAFEQAKMNISNCSWNKRISLHHLSYQEYLLNAGHQFDLIVCNPPYFINSLKTNEIARNLARHNEKLSHADLLKCSFQLLSTEGKLAVILPYTEGCVFIAEAAGYGLFCSRKTNVKTKPSTPTRRLLLEFSKTPVRCVEHQLIIGTGSGITYSEEYIKMTKEFYLKF
jgi:tRNA1Val (adenine37-N6)-methyltransferase